MNEYLGSLAEIIMGQSPPGENCNNTGNGVPLLNGPTEFGAHHPVPAQYTTTPLRMAKAGDILFCVRGSTTGRMSWADREYAIGRGIAAIRHKRGIAFQPFLRALIEFRLPNLLAQATGSTFPNVSFSQLAGLPCEVPIENEQRGIARILGSLDDKIELNRKMNETLEAIARALFKSWFVDFDPVHAKAEGRQPAGIDAETAALFPDAFEDCELGQIPRGWKVGTLQDCCVRIENGGTPRRDEPKYWEPGVIPWLMSGEVRQSIVIETQSLISEEGYASSAAKLWDAGTTVVALYGATAGQVCYLASKMCANQACCGLIPKNTMKFYLYLHASSHLESFQRYARGSAQQNLSQQIVAHYSALLPSDAVMKAFDRIVSPIFGKWVGNLRQSHTLAALRDALLPKLVSGEVRVPPQTSEVCETSEV